MKNKTPLLGLFVLNTRPLPLASRLSHTLQELGATVTTQPTMAMQPASDLNALQTAILQLPHCDLAVMASPYSILQAVPKILSAHHAWPASTRLAVLGLGSQHVLQSLGLSADCMPQADAMNSEGLVRALRPHYTNARIMVFKGDNPDSKLITALQSLTPNLIEVQAYQRQQPCWSVATIDKLCAPQRFDLVISTSLDNLKNLQQLLGNKAAQFFQSTSLLVISQQMQDYAIQNIQPQVMVSADNATDNAIIQAILKWQASQGKDNG